MMSASDFELILKHLEDNNDRWNVLTMRGDLEKAVREIIRLKSIMEDSSFESNVVDFPAEVIDTLEACSRK